MIVNCTLEDTDTKAVMYQTVNYDTERKDLWIRPSSEFLDRFMKIEKRVDGKLFPGEVTKIIEIPRPHEYYGLGDIIPPASYVFKHENKISNLPPRHTFV